MILVILNSLLISFIFLCWGSFLNVVAYRLLYNRPFWQTRSQCVSCSAVIAWYDLIPLVSWLLLRGRCRNCSAAISWLYFLIESLSLVFFWGLFLKVAPPFWLGYGILFSALLVTIRTDLEEMLILRPFSLGLIPLGLGLSAFNLLPITLAESFTGAFVGFAFLWVTKKIYFWLKKQEGMGAGDPELLAGIGAFVGPLGCWQTVLIGSFLGTLVGLYLMRQGAISRTHPLPFGPFLALGAFLVVLLA